MIVVNETFYLHFVEQYEDIVEHVLNNLGLIFYIIYLILKISFQNYLLIVSWHMFSNVFDGTAVVYFC